MLKTNKRNTLFKWAEEIEEYTSEKCVACGGPAHPATGFVLSDKAILCGPCAQDFYQWYRKRMNNQNRPKDGSSWNENASKSIIGD